MKVKRGETRVVHHKMIRSGAGHEPHFEFGCRDFQPVLPGSDMGNWDGMAIGRPHR